VIRKSKNRDQAHFQSGSALVYILIAIALLAALTASFMKPASQQTTAQNSFKAISNLKSQIEFIRSSIQECVLNHDGGDQSDTVNIPAGVNGQYPLTPTDNYFTLTSGSGAASSTNPDNKVTHIGCPGNPGTSKDHAQIFGGSSGRFLPPAPDLFEDWEYYNNTDGVFFYTRTNKTDAFLQTAMAKLDEQFSECEADVIDATAAEVAMTDADGASDPDCPTGNTCFRLWVIANGTATYQTGGDEDTAGCP